jgi:hypothetical protein
MLTLLTATGARPEAWARCERLMARQTYAGPVRWVIVDDGPEPQPVTFQRDGWALEMVRPTPHWQPGQNTQARNLRAGLARIGAGERVAIIEDDDHYAADWLATVAAELDRAELVGEPRARYYNIPRRVGRQLSNSAHASLCSTAMRGRALALFRAVCNTNHKFIDLELWRKAPSRHLFGGHRVVGLKGLPGRGGIGMGHADGFSGTADPAGALLREWVGADAEELLCSSS